MLNIAMSKINLETYPIIEWHNYKIYVQKYKEKK